ncbi:MAG: zinc-binding dehydrogenase [Bdellovibrionales bacterium]|nr:zinc-binding dehydrogenase [Bdellovibrionales bacterium]
MKAIIYDKLGGPEVLQYKEVEAPTKNDVTIKLAFASINHTDIHFRRGLPGMKSPLPHIPGCDGAGIVEEVSSTSTELQVGDRVAINPTIYCYNCEFCKRGDLYLCKNEKLVGREISGTYAEYISVPKDNVIKLPKNFDLQIAAASPLVYQTAYAMVVTKGKLEQNQTVLVMGAGSGVGMAAIQIAKHIGATVITTASTEDKCAKALDALHADHVIQYTKENLKEHVKALTEKQGVDVIIDHVGGSQWTDLLTLLKNGGKLVTCGATAGYNPTIDLRHVFFRQLQILGSTMASPEDMQKVMNLIFENKITPHIDQVFPLAQVYQAHQHIEDRRVFGKVLLAIS